MKCFQKKKNCLDICYYKYVKTIGKIEGLNRNIGKEKESELIMTTYGYYRHVWDQLFFQAGQKGQPSYSYYSHFRIMSDHFFPNAEGINTLIHPDLWR